MHQELNVILAQKPRRLTGNIRLRLMVAALVLPFIGVMAAFGIAPDTINQPIAKARVEEIALPALQPGPDFDSGFWREERIQRRDTLATLLARLGAEDSAALDYMHGARGARTLYQLIPGRPVHARISADGKLLALRYHVSGRVLSVQRDGDAFSLSETPVELERRVLTRSGEIRSSLFAAADAINMPDAIAVQIADIFSTDIDFHRDLRKGDRFTVAYEMYYDQGELARVGRVLAAEFISQGRPYQAVYFQNAEGKGGYYTPDSRNIRKAFLRSPLEFSRITSGFTHSRLHPVLQQWRAHMGIDYAAAIGTRVRATGDGVVEFVGEKGSYGNLVVLRHQSKYTTWYGHLSRFAAGMRKGTRVAQGDVIGYVGATGLASGPHVHYEFRINDVHHNPLRVVMPAAPPISADQKAAFEAAAAPLAQLLALLHRVNLAQRD
jgi:murein DD-endopeptidase MepM/ murein hydrolase activator NlpD